MAMVKGYQAYRDSWAAVLSKMPCPRELSWKVVQFFIDMKTWQRSMSLKGVVNCRILLT